MLCYSTLVANGGGLSKTKGKRLPTYLDQCRLINDISTTCIKVPTHLESSQNTKLL